jgi:hypothetical protein
MMAYKTTALLLGAETSQAQNSQPWPIPVRCGVQDSPNKYLWIMMRGGVSPG